jgi:hypothetical protein
MPLKKGWSQDTIGGNIAELKGKGMGRAQRIAAALAHARRSADEAGKPEEGPEEPDPKRAKRLAKVAGKLRGMKDD